MRSFIPIVRSLLTSDDGPTAVEYAVLLMAILMMVIVTVGVLGSTSGGMWTQNQTKLEEVGF